MLKRDLVLQFSREHHSRWEEPSRKRRKLDEDVATIDLTSGPSTPHKKRFGSHTPLSDDELVTCPMCDKSVRMDLINSHMDNNCASLKPLELTPKKLRPESKVKQKAAWSKLMAGAHSSKGKDKDVYGKPADSSTPCVEHAYPTDQNLRIGYQSSRTTC
jgi:hypothetical protein